jgi:hypothetical protein
MNAKNLMPRAALAASVVGSLGFAGLSPASATLVTLSGLGSDFGGGSPYSESGLTSPSDTGGFVDPNGGSSVVTVTPTPHGGVNAFEVTSGQFLHVQQRRCASKCHFHWNDGRCDARHRNVA